MTHEFGPPHDTLVKSAEPGCATGTTRQDDPLYDSAISALSLPGFALAPPIAWQDVADVQATPLSRDSLAPAGVAGLDDGPLIVLHFSANARWTLLVSVNWPPPCRT